MTDEELYEHAILNGIDLAEVAQRIGSIVQRYEDERRGVTVIASTARDE